MKLVIKILGIIFILLGISLIIDPEIIFGLIEDDLEKESLYFSAIIGRFIFGILLILVAKESKYPIFFKIFGYLVIIAAIVFIFIGHEGFKDMITSVIPVFKPYGVVAGIVVIALGSFFIYAASGDNKVKSET